MLSRHVSEHALILEVWDARVDHMTAIMSINPIRVGLVLIHLTTAMSMFSCAGSIFMYICNNTVSIPAVCSTPKNSIVVLR